MSEEKMESGPHGSTSTGSVLTDRTVIEIEARRKHIKLCDRLCGYMSNDKKFRIIKKMARSYFSMRILEQAKDMDDLWCLLENRGIIDVGMYDKLIEMMTDFGMEEEIDVIHKTAIEIQDIMQSYIPDKKQSEKSSLDAYTESQESIHPSSEKLPYLKPSLTLVESKSDIDILKQDIMALRPEVSIMEEDGGSVLGDLEKDMLSIRYLKPSLTVIESKSDIDLLQHKIVTQKPDVNIMKEDRGDVFGDLEEDLKDEFLVAIKNNDQKIEEMISNRKIPKRSVMKVAMKQKEYSKGVQRALNEMSKLLRMEISEAVGVWCGYAPNDPHIPVFVVTLKKKNCILKNEDIPEPFKDYKIITRHKYVPNDEERSIVELYGSGNVRSEDVSLVNNCIATHTERLMSEHSNLSIISPCPIKAYGYLKKKMEVEKNTCIVFYVPVKGIIPVGEKEFPKALDGIVTDVREGEFVFLGGHNAMKYHPKLRMGCCISRCTCETNGCKGTEEYNIGSLGGFVDLPGDKVGCLTAAHVVLTHKEYQIYIAKNHEEKGMIHYNLAAGDVQMEMHQPYPLVGHKPFGKVLTIALEQGEEKEGGTPSVDAAIIQITDDDRIPETGSFPDGEFGDFGLTKEDPLLYTGGEILDDTEIKQMESDVIKFGCTTGLTQGKLKCSQSSVRRVDVWGNYVFPVMYKQLEVSSAPHVFADMGDSGALVFLCHGANNRNIRPFGMVLGENSTGCTCVVTPIKAVFEKLGLRSHRFKVFPASQLSQLKEHIVAQEQTHNQVLNGVLEKLESIEQQMIGTIEEKVNSVVQKMNFNSSVNTLEDNMKESIEKINSRVDTLEKNMKESSEQINSNIKESFTRMMEALNQLNNKS